MTWNLCSHLIRVWRGSGPAHGAVLEEICETGARFGSDTAPERGTRVTIEAGPVALSAEVVAVTRRENDYLVETSFLEDYRWSPSEWTPDHLIAGPETLPDRRAD